MTQHRQRVSQVHQGQGPEVISLDWTYAHVDGLETSVQAPNQLKAEEAYWMATAQQSYEQMDQAQRRLSDPQSS